jgi:hypothetical protein
MRVGVGMSTEGRVADAEGSSDGRTAEVGVQEVRHKVNSRTREKRRCFIAILL